MGYIFIAIFWLLYYISGQKGTCCFAEAIWFIRRWHRPRDFIWGVSR